MEENWIAFVLPTFEKTEWKESIEPNKDFIWSNGLRFLRHYQLKAIPALQNAVWQGKDRTFFEMAAGTGKTFFCCGHQIAVAILKRSMYLVFAINPLKKFTLLCPRNSKENIAFCADTNPV